MMMTRVPREQPSRQRDLLAKTRTQPGVSGRVEDQLYRVSRWNRVRVGRRRIAKSTDRPAQVKIETSLRGITI